MVAQFLTASRWGSVSDNPCIYLRVTREFGKALGEEIFVGRCVQLGQ